MSGNYKNEDLRIIKTHNALFGALELLLQRRSFKQITVNDICEEALTSRAAFYAHFKDKYDLLRFWLDRTKSRFENVDIETLVGKVIYDSSKTIRNLFTELDNELSDILLDFTVSFIKKYTFSDECILSEDAVIATFCVGGMQGLLSWQVRQNFPESMQGTKKYLCELISLILNWYSKKSVERKKKEQELSRSKK